MIEKQNQLMYKFEFEQSICLEDMINDNNSNNNEKFKQSNDPPNNQLILR